VRANPRTGIFVFGSEESTRSHPSVTNCPPSPAPPVGSSTVHLTDPAFGSQATELVHISEAAMVSGGMVDSLVDVVFNDPTLAEAYKVALARSRNGEPQRSPALRGRPVRSSGV
jgi:hypothetical protein